MAHQNFTLTHLNTSSNYEENGHFEPENDEVHAANARVRMRSMLSIMKYTSISMLPFAEKASVERPKMNIFGNIKESTQPLLCK